MLLFCNYFMVFLTSGNISLKNEKAFISVNEVVGPVDRVVRAAVGLIILTASFTLQLSIFEMTEFFSVTIYLWLTGLTRWDPFYALFYKLFYAYKTNSAIKGKF